MKCCVSLFPHVRKVIRPIRSCVSCFFTCEPYGKLKFSFKAGWRGFVHRTSHRFASLKRANSLYLHFFHHWSLKVPVSVKQKQKGGGKEFELRSQTPTKQPWTQIHVSQLCTISCYIMNWRKVIQTSLIRPFIQRNIAKRLSLKNFGESLKMFKKWYIW